jgi:hypothetical protein
LTFVISKAGLVRGFFVLACLLAAGLASAQSLCGNFDAFTRLRCEEGEAIARSSSKALRYGGVLFVVSDKKIHPHFDWPGTPATPEMAYLYQGFEPRIHAHVVRYATAVNLEGGVELINKKSGQRVSSVGASPMIAPGGQYLLTVTDEARYRISEIQIWRAQEDGFRNVAKFYAQGWKPSGGPHKWLDDNTLQIARQCPEGNTDKAPCPPAQIVRQGVSWKLLKTP